MTIKASVLVPHPPLIFAGAAATDTSDLDNTRRAYADIAKTVAELQPDTIIIATPHNIQYREFFHVSPGAAAHGDMSKFNCPEVAVSVDYDEEFVFELGIAAARAGIPVSTDGEQNSELDHGCVIPLHYIQEAYGGHITAKVVRISPSGLPLTEHYRLGRLIRDVSDSLGRNIVFIASGDLSHVLQDYGPYGLDVIGPSYDYLVTDLLEKADFGELMSFPDDLRERARECGHGVIVMLTGTLDGLNVKANKLSYHDMLGIGYCVCKFMPGRANGDRCYYDDYMDALREALRKRHAAEDEVVRLARQAAAHYAECGELLPVPEQLPHYLLHKHNGVYVNLYKLNELRGASGYCYPQQSCTAAEIIAQAAAAAAGNDDAPPLHPTELEQLVITVDILSEPEIITTPSKLDPRTYGIVVSAGERQAVMLPDVEGINTPSDQVEAACEEAGISLSEPFQIQRFAITRHF